MNRHGEQRITSASKRAERSATDLFQLDESSSIPIWLQLKNRLIYLITSGYYLAGDQLPTVRSMAADIAINYNTVSKVYKSLEEDGYIISKRRQGVFVCDVSHMEEMSIAVSAETMTVDYIQRCQEMGLSLEEIGSLFGECLCRMRSRRMKEQGEGIESHVKEDTAGASIISFSSAEADTRQRPARNGA